MIKHWGRMITILWGKYLILIVGAVNHVLLNINIQLVILRDVMNARAPNLQLLPQKLFNL